jgi:hypothetical protein
MKRLASLLVMALFLPGAASAGQRLTLYLDGGVVEREVRSSGGLAELIIPAAADRSTLRVFPAPGASLLEVQQLEARPTKQQQKELAAAEERRRQLQDRLQALAVREEIYRGAAKSQSAKAPRKTKANPEPMAAIRQGTDYAIGQLESVLRLQRRAREEMTQVEGDLERLRRQANLGGVLLRVRSDRRDAPVRVRYLQRDLRWRPSAALRVNGPAAELQLLGGLPPLPPDSAVTVVAAAVGDTTAARHAVNGPFRLSFSVASLREEPSAGLFEAVTYRFTTSLPLPLLPEEAACYRNGDYLGTPPLRRSAGSAELELTCGR